MSIDEEQRHDGWQYEEPPSPEEQAAIDAEASKAIEEYTWHEFQIGVYVEADTQEEAWRKLQPSIKALNDVDPEGDATVEYIGFMCMDRKAQ